MSFTRSTGPSAPSKDVDGTAGQSPRGRRAARRLRPLVGLVTTLGMLGVWELSARGGMLPSQIPPLTDVAEWLGRQFGVLAFWRSLGLTLWHWAAGLLISVIVGISVGVTIGALPLLHRLLQPTFETLRPIPSFIYLPLVVLVWGSTSQTAILLVVTGALWPMLFQTNYGVNAVDPMLHETGKLFGLTARQRVVNITLPSILPYVATGIRISSSLALIVAIGVELIGGIPGLGADLGAYANNGVYPAVYGIIVVTGVLGLALNAVLERGERRLLKWHVAHRGMST